MRETGLDLSAIPADLPVVIAGPTASGKSALALAIAAGSGGVVVNADALQIFDGWRILTARPSRDEEAVSPHALYGHMPYDAEYSVGHWLRDVTPFLSGPARPIIVGGTGLYLTALTEGLAEIPATPPEIRVEADTIPLPQLVADLDPRSRNRIDLNNRARVQRAWEVLRATGRGIADWQADTPRPLLPADQAHCVVLMPEKEWLNDRITRRFDMMLSQGALEEAEAMLPNWNPAHLSSKAIGAPELIAHLKGEITLDDARERAIIASRQYAKRQRTWFRARMAGWEKIQKLSTG
ncbi:tRNA (adenosine(37)-N6)-dimethylallyltransferase MiaA [Loktanella sp. IMCC34160]|uniref:tRNA (adenosine(37)-N6)-dimethylallyltransferase MiaA n=1 Tax=Loktanella sp. IMCC34160 TaxID=2510646 RepID=UPI00101C9FBA|nr:tRNA (adenosine(37)-N6)-dimethylallyltransferase MiaA [Loktanella sp. IMCC34160]RYG92187.1 tRNA (adenosine(37)-N6)-dimethylallyltransferase MiaA [Loktanella sp. IMCC34160]